VSASIARELRKATRAWAPNGTSHSEQAARDLSLAWGAAGLLIADSYCGSVGQENRVERRAGKLVDGLLRHPLPPTLYRGFWGIGWSFAHMKRSGITDAFDTEGLDESLTPSLEWMRRGRAHDLMRGLVGLGVYALEHPVASHARRTVRSVVSELGRLCVWSEEGASWPTPAEALDTEERGIWPNGRVDLGMAHGSGGVIAFLAAAAQRERTAQTVRLLEGAVSWLLKHQQRRGQGSFFAAYAGETGKPSKTALAWCVGDLGISVSLALAARALGRDDWREEALRLALHSAKRPAGDAVNDTSLCHGSAGLAHLFSRLHQYLGHSALRAAAVRWYGRCLAAETPERFRGFGAPRYAGSRRHDPGFLMGAAGVALALQAATSERAPSWDRVLLLSTT
jgi:lantibiotic modifying enzyme